MTLPNFTPLRTKRPVRTYSGLLTGTSANSDGVHAYAGMGVALKGDGTSVNEKAELTLATGRGLPLVLQVNDSRSELETERGTRDRLTFPAIPSEVVDARELEEAEIEDDGDNVLLAANITNVAANMKQKDVFYNAGVLTLVTDAPNEPACGRIVDVVAPKYGGTRRVRVVYYQGG